ncbi:MAG: 2-hydroxychromene-2-carboxylate isomerase, partial [Burkholderiales bacterium]|nr:2-hydroxychromene-2-carboxylate isomerase [Burkholderiales bacterium]
NKLAYERLEMQRFITRHGLAAFKFNPHFPVNTLQVMRGAVAAQQLGCFERYVDTVFAAMWERALKMDDPATIADVLTQAGLDAQRLMQTAQEPAVKARLLENTQAAHDRGAFGAPTFFVGDEMYFGKDRLHEVEEAIGRA